MYDNIVYNNEILSDFLIIKNLREDFTPEIINNRLQTKGRAGSIFINQEFGERRIDLDVEILANSKYETKQARDKLNSLLFAGGGEGKLYINERYYTVVVDSISSVTNMMYDVSFTISFLATDPISYGELISLKVKSDQTLYNRGTYKATPKIYFNASSNKAKVHLVTDSGGNYNYVEINNLKIGDKVVIDFYEERAYVNGVSYPKNISPSSDFFFIEHGEFKIDYSGASDLRLEYRERWL